jgi:serine/threonine protein kinase
LLSDSVIKQLETRMILQDQSVTLSDLNVVKTLGSGMFGTVYLTTHATSGAPYALKGVLRAKIDEHMVHKNIVDERQILLEIDHVIIMKLVKTMKDAKRVYFLSEFING